MQSQYDASIYCIDIFYAQYNPSKKYRKDFSRETSSIAWKSQRGICRHKNNEHNYTL